MMEDLIITPVDARVMLAIGKAVKEHYRIERCEVCGGPQVFSKVSALSRCFRCGHRRELVAVAQHKVSWRRCELCDKQNMAGVPIRGRLCRDCQALSDRERRKRLRWKRERVGSAPESANEIKGVSTPDPESGTLGQSEPEREP